MKYPRFERLESRLVATVGMGLLAFSVIAGFFTYRYVYQRELELAASLQRQLVRTIQDQAEVAAFAANPQIAQGVLSGLVANPVILAGQIESASGFKVDLGYREKASRGSGTSYPLLSPVDHKEPIGTLTVVQNDDRVRASAVKAALFQTALLLLQVLIAVIITAAVLRVMMIRPITRLAKTMASIEPGSSARLEADADHARDEIELLSNSANSLLEASERAINQERSLRILLEATGRVARIGGWTLDVQSMVLNWTDETYRIHELELAEPVDVDRAIRFYAPAERQTVANAVQECITRGLPFDLELQLITAPGNLRWVRAQGTAAQIGGKTVRVYGAIQDITEHKDADDVLRASEEKYRALVETTATGYLIVDTEGRVLDANLEYVRLTGHAQLSDILGRSVLEWTADHEKEMNARAVAQCARDGFIRNLIVTYVGPNGRNIPIEVNATVIIDGEVTRIIALCRDITERKQAEAELLAAKTEAEAASLTKSRFLAAASHDLRQPMQAISLFHEALARTGLTGEQRQISEYLGQSIGSLDDLLSALLDISKLDAGAVKACPEVVQAAALVGKIDADYSALAAEKSLRFKLCFPYREMAILTDPKLLLSLLGNLIGNAIKYTKQGGILVAIRRRRGQALIQVWDSGIGIGGEHLDSIYEEYFQIGNPERDRSKGLGLGLAIAQRLAKLLGTEVVCRSRSGKGSVFEFCLPLADLSTTGEASQLDPAAVEADAFCLASRHIVVVEDDRMVATAIQLSLEALGISVTRYATAEEALAAPGIADADFYISDFRLPGMNGVEFLDAIAQRCTGPVKAVLLTGDTSTERIAITESSSWKVLFKPVDLSRLIAAVESQESVL